MDARPSHHRPTVADKLRRLIPQDFASKILIPSLAAVRRRIDLLFSAGDLRPSTARQRQAYPQQPPNGQPAPSGPARPPDLQLPQIPHRYFWQGRLAPAFWTTASLLSLTVNIVLLVVLLLLARELFSIKALLSDQLVGGLHENFVAMDQAHIRTTIAVKDTIRVDDTIQVDDTIPVVFDLPLNQATEVTLVGDTPVNNATIYLNGQAVPLNLVLRQGTRLGIALNLTVPVSQTVPVRLTVPVQLDVPVDLQVPVDIPLDQTELHRPFTGLQEVVVPYDNLLASLPASWQETGLCKPWFGWVCRWLQN